MLLAIDIGNTKISFGVFKARRLVKNFSIPTEDYSIAKLKKKLHKISIDDCIVCSVVPRTARILKHDLRKLLPKKILVLGENIRVPIKNLYRKPKEVGQDRLVNAYAGVTFYKTPLIIVDFGTAVTFDVISRKKEYLGGMILPGIKISLDTLVERAALLPKIKLDKPKEFIGRDTRNSMLSGIIYGFAALTDDMTERIKNRIGKRAKVIGTGGDAYAVRTYCKSINEINRDLTLRGLDLIYHKYLLKKSS